MATATPIETSTERMLISGNQAVALACLHAKVSLGTGYPGTPSTEILESFDALGGRAQWAPNEKVAMEVGLGAAYAGAKVLVTMKHVGVNVAADPLFTAAYTGVDGSLVMIAADDPGMASSQNEQDSRRYAVAAGVPMFEPSDSQETYDMTLAAFQLSHTHQMPCILRMTTRICHSKTIVVPNETDATRYIAEIKWERDIPGRVMVPGYARPAHRRLHKKLDEMAVASDNCPFNYVSKGDGSSKRGIITSSISYVHAREAAPDCDILKLGMSYPLPMNMIRQFIEEHDDVICVEEGDPYLVEQIRAVNLPVDGKDEMYRFGEFDVARVKRILANDTTEEEAPPKGKPPQLCTGCPHRNVFEILRDLGCIVAGDIGCYTLGVLPPFTAMDTCVCMGASVGVGLGLRHVLPDEQAKKVVSVIGDSTFVHSGLTGMAEMVYNPPKTGHVLMILDNGTTAMTGQQEHPGTGRTLDHEPTGKIDFETMARAMGIERVYTIDPVKSTGAVETTLKECLDSNELSVIVTRRPCILAAGKIKEWETAATEKCGCDCQPTAD